MTRPLVPDYIRDLTPYKPGKPIREVQRELGLERVVKLASNENPRGASPLALEAIRNSLAELARYPDVGALDLPTTSCAGRT
jgi:histidinol-phosphate aminotransferase